MDQSRCPICKNEMIIKSQDVSNGEGIKKYDRTVFWCEKCDVWINQEVPTIGPPICFNTWSKSLSKLLSWVIRNLSYSASALSFALHCTVFCGIFQNGNNHFLIQFSFFKNILQMFWDCRDVNLKKLCHLFLRQPKRLIVKKHINIHLSSRCLKNHKIVKEF